MDYSKTVNLPKTGFKMKAGLTQKEPMFLKRWEKMGLYQKQLEKREGAPLFILHDGPPYANGPIHMGHALNKILKDIIVKYKYFSGFKTPYVPGWDCHGLPIEHKVTKELGEKAKDLSTLKLLELCRKYAEKNVKMQMEGFKRIGVFGDYSDPYLTLNSRYEAATMEAFGALVKKGYIYRGERPVYWSPDSVTALAEAEVEYHDIESHSIYVKFPVREHKIDGIDGSAFVMIWTTTPWTLPANSGLSFHPTEQYLAVKVGGEWLILAEALKDSVLAIKGLTAEKEIKLSKEDIESLHVRHLWIDRQSKVIFGEHVTMDTGTGIVHTAPGHGMEDYLAGLDYGLEIISPVDDHGCYTSEVPEWEGQKVLESNDDVIELLKQKGLLYQNETFTHSYPHDWRTKTPVIFRTKPQWFFRVSDPELAKIAIDELPKVHWKPAWGEERIKNMLNGRPDWCLSRQRKWGVPIPAFYCEACGEAVLDGEIIDSVAKVVEKEGIAVWYKKEASDFLPESFKCPKCGKTHFKKETDILDVWFDSGVSHYAVLDKREGLESPADLYLEGGDQYRGWFQSSLWMSVAMKGEAPFKAALTNGWVLDEKGKPMHKSLGNAILPDEVYNTFGADVLRLWVVTEDYTREIRCGNNLMTAAAENYRKIRNTFRYLLGNLNGFTPDMAVDYKKMTDFDQFALAKLYDLETRVKAFYDSYDFHRAFREVHNFCVIDLSNQILDILKDRLYILSEECEERRSAQTMMYFVMKHLMFLLAPILTFTMEEIYLKFFAEDENTDSLFLQDWPELQAEWKNDSVKTDFEKLMEVRELALKSLEELRTKGDIGTSLEAKILLSSKNDELKSVLAKYADELRYSFIVSQVEILDEIDAPQAENEFVALKATKADGKKCARCWNYSVHVGEDSEHPELCERCAPVVKSLPQDEEK